MKVKIESKWKWDQVKIGTENHQIPVKTQFLLQLVGWISALHQW